MPSYYCLSVTDLLCSPVLKAPRLFFPSQVHFFSPGLEVDLISSRVSHIFFFCWLLFLTCMIPKALIKIKINKQNQLVLLISGLLFSIYRSSSSVHRTRQNRKYNYTNLSIGLYMNLLCVAAGFMCTIGTC